MSARFRSRELSRLLSEFMSDCKVQKKMFVDIVKYINTHPKLIDSEQRTQLKMLASKWNNADKTMNDFLTINSCTLKIDADDEVTAKWGNYQKMGSKISADIQNFIKIYNTCSEKEKKIVSNSRK